MLASPGITVGRFLYPVQAVFLAPAFSFACVFHSPFLRRYRFLASGAMSYAPPANIQQRKWRFGNESA
jgi:hypothetical protein